MKDVVYCSGNRFFVLGGDLVPLECSAQSIEKYRAALKNMQKQNEWKTTGSGAIFMGTAQRGSLDAEADSAYIRGIARFDDGILYSVNTGSTGSVYRKIVSGENLPEGHVLSSGNMEIFRICACGNKCVMSTGNNALERHISIMELPSADYRELTEGDVREDYPSFSRDGRRVYYSTAGLGIAASGAYTGEVGPYGIFAYDLENNDITEVLASDEYDYIMPREAPDGSIYFIKRPYNVKKVNSGNIFTDIVMFPVRIVKAIGGLLNFFSIMFGGESLRSGGNAKTTAKAKQKDEKMLFIEGNMINADETLEANSRKGEKFPGIIPRSWELVCVSTDGKHTCMKKGVMDYTLCSDGDIVYSNGQAVIRLLPDGSEELLTKSQLACNIVEM